MAYASPLRDAPAPNSFAQLSSSGNARRISFDESSDTLHESATLQSPQADKRGVNKIYFESNLDPPRMSKISKIRELRAENKKLRASLEQLDSKKRRNSQTGEDTREENAQEKHLEALRALTAVTKKQQECIEAHEVRSAEIFRELEYHQAESHRRKKELATKKKEAVMLESQIDANLTEITCLRKELALTTARVFSLECERKTDRVRLMGLTKDLARTRAGKNDASEDVKSIADKIEIFEQEIAEKANEIEDQQNELMNQKEMIQRLYVDLERAQDQVEKCEKERDATVSDMETYYEALKHELKEKNRLLEAAEQERQDIEQETSETVRILENQCDQLSSELLQADEELLVLRRGKGLSNGAAFEEERQLLNLNLEAMSEELEETKRRLADMGVSHGDAYRELDHEAGELLIELKNARAALRECDIRIKGLSTENEMLKVENSSLLEISQDLQLQLRVEQYKVRESASSQCAVDERRGPSSSSISQPTSRNTVKEDKEINDNDSDTEKGTGSLSTTFSDKGITDRHPSPSTLESPRSTQQALLLQAAAARKTQQESYEKGMNGSWRSKVMNLGGQIKPPSFLPSPTTGPGTPHLSPLATSDVKSTTSVLDLDNPDKDKVIESLQRTNKQLEDSVDKLKSEIVRLNSFYKDAAYLSKKIIASLTQENVACETKLLVLEKMLEKLGGCIDSPDEDRNNSRSKSAVPKFHHRILELEEIVSTLEKEKNEAESKMKAVESDLENFQRTSKQASLDSLHEIECLRNENTEHKRRLASFENKGIDAIEGDTVLERVQGKRKADS
jgi:chromosome segregation ATPase